MIPKGPSALLLCFLLGAGLAGCAAPFAPKPPIIADLAAEVVRGDRPEGPEGACWAGDETPAVIETVTEQIAEDANAPGDASYRTETRQEIVQAREKVWFRVPCEAELTPEVIATLQRALAVRGFYRAQATGELDAATRAAIRAFQAPRGLNSDRLSLVAARELGVIAADLQQAAGDRS